MKVVSVIYRTVELDDLAVVKRSGALPVLATPVMICWMEEASCEIAKTQPGFTTVGISLEVSHDAPSALGSRIRIVSQSLEREGKIETFAVSAWHKDRCIGQGIHKRAMVNIERFMSRLEKQSS